MGRIMVRLTAMKLNLMRWGGVAALAAGGLLLAGCAHEHSSNYRRGDFSAQRALKSHYEERDQLSEADVLGARAKRAPSEEDIQNALSRSSAVDLKAGETVLVLQSGETMPDAGLVAELNKHYRAVPFSGIRSDWSSHWENMEDYYPKSLRYAAAKAGAQKLLCVWGTLEVARHDFPTKTITWLPVVDIIVPDQNDAVRVHLKVALVDVRTGEWSVFRTEPVQTKVVSTGWSREHLETSEVKELKEKSYVVAVNTLLTGKP